MSRTLFRIPQRASESSEAGSRTRGSQRTTERAGGKDRQSKREKEHRKVEQQDRRLEQQEATIAQQQKQIDALTAGLQTVSDRLEMSKSAQQIAFNNQ
jgi:predicted RNase H-like nuclease (RuvC/YqgF family)